ncbi:MAG: hypothetical protein HYX75_16820 [Acidobacteria bacterium]|nr:hypothetical protein [Acidobacteriota bacterium]
MMGINIGRWLAGGLVAGLVGWIIEGVAGTTYTRDVQSALEAHNLPMDMSASVFILSVVASLIEGLTLVFFYAVARVRFGPGPRTAVIVAVTLWIGGNLLSLFGYQIIGLFPLRVLLMWGAIGLAKMILAALVGGWIYRESWSSSKPPRATAGRHGPEFAAST